MNFTENNELKDGTIRSWSTSQNTQTESDNLTSILLMKPNDIKQIIESNITDHNQHDHVFHMVALFLLHKPDVAEKLLDFIKQGEAWQDFFVYLVYQHIEDILIKCRDSIDHEIWPIENPGKQQVTKVLENIQNRKEKLAEEDASGDLDWMSVPGFPIGLLSKERI